MIICNNCDKPTDDYHIFQDRKLDKKRIKYCRECYEEYMYLQMHESFREKDMMNGFEFKRAKFKKTRIRTKVMR